MKKVTVAAIQMSCCNDIDKNIRKAETKVAQAADDGANIVLLQELFSTVYFCQEISYKYFELAHEEKDNSLLSSMQSLARKYNIVLPISFFEKANQTYYNSVAIIDANGEIIGKYRKSHIPDDPGYYEKFYFTPGDIDLKVWDTKYAKIGVGICWDQWFPEVARCFALQGAEILLYPTAIGTVPVKKGDPIDQNFGYRRWQRAMIGHSVANTIPVVAANRIGIEQIGETVMQFFGASFICNCYGDKVSEASNYDETICMASLDLDESADLRMLRFRDRRTDLYNPLLTKDGRHKL